MRVPFAALTLALTLLTRVTAVSASEPLSLRAGPLTMTFDTDLAFLRYVNIGPHEVLRGINAPIRNDIWGTVVPSVTNVELTDGGDHFALSFDAVCQEPGLDFRWKGTLTGTAAGEVIYTFDGTAHSTFQKNRIGFCILHGPSAAGQTWTIEQADGQRNPGRFPALISPHQPAKNIRGITHEVAPGIRAQVRMEGDVWEMEDQRNWTDASFKTYCTPLEIPYPVEITAGTKIVQKVTLSVAGRPEDESGDGNLITLDLPENVNSLPALRLPRIGVQVSSEADTLTDAEIGRLHALHLDHLRVDLDPSADGWSDRLAAAAQQADKLSLELHVGLQLGEDVAFRADQLRSALGACPADLSTVLCLGASAERYEQIRTLVHATRPRTLVARGYDTNFVDLNRDRPQPGSVDAVTWAINPQIHAFDNASIVESLPIHTTTLQTAEAFCRQSHDTSSDGPPMLIGPITLRSPHMGRDPLPGQLPPAVDLRQPSLFAAAWTASCLHHLARGSAHSVTLYETAGWKGIMDLDHPPQRPGGFPSSPGHVFAVYHLLKEVADFSGGRVLPVNSSRLLVADALWLTDGQRDRIIVVNFSNDDQRLLIAAPKQGTMRQLDGDSLPTATADPDAWHQQPGTAVNLQQPFVLPGHAIAVIDCESN